MGVKVFTDLLIWKRSREWSKAIFQHTRNQPFKTDRRLVIQINDSSSSVMANIAEGFGRGTQGEFVLFIGYALGSLNETQSHLTAAYDRDYVSREDYAALFQEGIEIRKMTISFLTSMTMTGSGVRNLGKKPKSFSERAWEAYERITGRPRPDLHKPRSAVKGSAGADAAANGGAE
jgi:four helix bundle protein